MIAGDPMIQKRKGYLLFPVLGGIGFLLRLTQLKFGFEHGTGLAAAAFPPGIALVAAAGILCFAAFAAARMLPPQTPPLLPPRRRAARAVHAAAGSLTALMGVLLLPSSLGGNRMDLLLALISLCTALYLILAPFAEKGLRTFSFFEYTLFYTAWLAVLFSRHASDPVLMGFWPPLLALCAAAFSFYLLSCAVCGIAKPRRTRFFLLSGGSLCLIAAADGCTPSAAPYFCGFLAAALMQFFYADQLLFRTATT